MTFANPVGGVIVQSGTDTDLSGLTGVTGVTTTSFTELLIQDLGTNRLEVTGTMTINGATDGSKEMMILGVAGGTQNVDIDISSTGTMIVGSLDSQGGVEFNQAASWPSIFEDAATDFGDGNGNISNDGGTTDAFINVEGGGRMEWYGTINSTGGMRFKGANDGASGDEAEIVIRGGVLDARRLTERGAGEADQFLYNYSDELDIAPPSGGVVGFTILTDPTTGANEKGLAILQLGEPIQIVGFRPVFTSQAFGGSNSASIDLTYTVTGYTGIVGIVGLDNIDMRSASIASNTSVITFLDSAIGSTLKTATQNPGFASIVCSQALTADAVNATNDPLDDSVIATFSKTGQAVFDDTPVLGEFDLGTVELVEFTPPHTAPANDKPEAEYNSRAVNVEDLWSFYCYSYLGVDRTRIDVLLRDVNGRNISFSVPTDLRIAETDRTIVDGYTAISNLARFYDRCKSHKVDNIQLPVVQQTIAQAQGSIVDLGEYDLVVDKDAVLAFEVSNAVADRDTVNQILAWELDLTFTIPAGENRMLGVIIGHENDPIREPVLVTYGGVELTRVHSNTDIVTETGTFGVGMFLYIMLEAELQTTIGTSIAIEWNVSPPNRKLFRAVFENVSQTEPIAGVDAKSTQLGEAALQQDPYAEENGLAIGFSINTSATTATWEAGVTEREDDTSTGFGFSVADRVPTTDGEISLDVTSTEHMIMSVALRPRQGRITVNPSGIARVGSTSAVVQDTPADEITIGFPAGIADDDVAYLFVGHPESDDNAWNTPSGWTVLPGLSELQTGGTPDTVPGLTVYRRIISGDTGSDTVTITNVGVNTSGIVAQMLAFRGVDVGQPEDVTPTTAVAASGNPDPASIDPTDINTLAIVVALSDTENPVTAAPSSYINRLTTTTQAGGVEGFRAAAPVQTTFLVAQSTGTFEVPEEVTEIEVKCWGAGSASGSVGGVGSDGGAGAGGGFAQGTITVTPGSLLEIRVGSPGLGGDTGTSGAGGGGGGLTGVFPDGDVTQGGAHIIAGAGGAGGGGDNGAGVTGADGGFGGGSTGGAGDDAGTTVGGGGGTQIAGGAAGTGDVNGTAGTALTGGAAGDGAGTNNGGAGAAGVLNGGIGGDAGSTSGGGGGGGSGMFGGGGGASEAGGGNAGSGGGGGSNKVTGTSTTTTQSTGTTVANDGDGDYVAGHGDGGATGTGDPGNDGEPGMIVLTYTVPGTSLDGCTLSTAERVLTSAALEDPGVFTDDEDEEWACGTIALRFESGDVVQTAFLGFDGVKTLGTVTIQNGVGVQGIGVTADFIIADVVNLSDVEILGDMLIETAGTYEFSNVTVSGDVTNSDASGNVTINAADGSSLTTSEPGTGNGEVNIINVVDVNFTGLVIGSEVRVLLTGTSTEVAGVEATGGTTFVAVLTQSVFVDYIILGPLSDPRVPIRVENVAFALNTTIPVVQLINRNYSDPD